LAVLLLTGLVAAVPAGDDASVEQFAQLLIKRQQVIVRVPRRQVAQAPIEWREKKGPRCIPMNALGGAAVTKPSSVDFMLRGGTRVRARLERECPALDYYSGFYISPTADGRICADRDAIHARSGGECQITRFRTLAPREAKKR
jgi:hypothetical protein